jgi:hypothetical protein
LYEDLKKYNRQYDPGAGFFETFTGANLKNPGNSEAEPVHEYGVPTISKTELMCALCTIIRHATT